MGRLHKKRDGHHQAENQAKNLKPTYEVFRARAERQAENLTKQESKGREPRYLCGIATNIVKCYRRAIEDEKCPEEVREHLKERVSYFNAKREEYKEEMNGSNITANNTHQILVTLEFAPKPAVLAKRAAPTKPAVLTKPAVPPKPAVSTRRNGIHYDEELVQQRREQQAQSQEAKKNSLSLKAVPKPQPQAMEVSPPLDLDVIPLTLGTPVNIPSVTLFGRKFIVEKADSKLEAGHRLT